MVNAKTGGARPGRDRITRPCDHGHDYAAASPAPIHPVTFVRAHPPLPWRRLAGYRARRLSAPSRCGDPARLAREHRQLEPPPSGSDGQAFLWELILTLFLVRDHGRGHRHRAVGEAAAIAIGGTVGPDAMFGGPCRRSRPGPTSDALIAQISPALALPARPGRRRARAVVTNSSAANTLARRAPLLTVRQHALSGGFMIGGRIDVSVFSSTRQPLWPAFLLYLGAQGAPYFAEPATGGVRGG
jgi:hypothetical protein